MLHTSDILLLDIKKPQTFYTTEPNHNFVLLLAQEILKRSINIFHFLKNHLVFFFLQTSYYWTVWWRFLPEISPWCGMWIRNWVLDCIQKINNFDNNYYIYGRHLVLKETQEKNENESVLHFFYKYNIQTRWK